MQNKYIYIYTEFSEDKSRHIKLVVKHAQYRLHGHHANVATTAGSSKSHCDTVQLQGSTLESLVILWR